MSIHDPRIYLASTSPRRRELLKQIGVHYEVLLLRTFATRADANEIPLQGEDPAEYVQRVAREKASSGWEAVQSRHLPKHPVLAADTTVSLNGDIIGKPIDRDDAAAMLKRFSGKTQQVFTAVAMAYRDRLEVLLSVTRVEFAELSDIEIKGYVMTGEPLDKAGGYAIQGRAAAFIPRIEGSYSGVMGLPLFETMQLLKKFDVEKEYSHL